METILEQIKSTCIHYNGYQKGECKYGVNYRNLVKGAYFGWAARLPCVPDSSLRKQPVSECQAFRFPTEEEAQAEMEKYEDLILSSASYSRVVYDVEEG